jgi:hypothetical protein
MPERGGACVVALTEAKREKRENKERRFLSKKI